MNKRWLVNGALALLVAVLALIAFNEPGKQEPAAPTKLTALRADQVSHVSVLRTDQPNIELEKTAAGWQVQPMAEINDNAHALPANPFRVDSIVKLVEADSYVQLHPSKSDLKQYGLAPPHISARLNDIQIAFGNTDPIKGLRYVQIGDTVHAVANTQYSQLLAEPLDFVNPELLPGQPAIKSMKLPNVRVELSPTGAWKVEPSPADYSADSTTKLVDEWRYARALSIARSEPATPQGEVSIELKQGSTVRFDILARQPQLLLGSPELGLTYKFAADVGERLLNLSAHKTAVAE